MSKCLPFKHDSLRKALVAHTLRVRLVIGTFVVHFVAKALKWSTILTFLIRLMSTLALCFDFCQVVVKALMLHNLLVFNS
jgi:hypothetical protein